jgi:hypothetical protein
MARAESLILEGACPSAQLMVLSAVASEEARLRPFVERHFGFSSSEGGDREGSPFAAAGDLKSD